MIPAKENLIQFLIFNLIFAIISVPLKWDELNN